MPLKAASRRGKQLLMGTTLLVSSFFARTGIEEGNTYEKKAVC